VGVRPAPPGLLTVPSCGSKRELRRVPLASSVARLIALGHDTGLQAFARSGIERRDSSYAR